MLAPFACVAIAFSLTHLFCVGLLLSRVRSTPLFSQLFRKNVKRGGYALRSEYLLPRAKRPELLDAMPQFETLYSLVRLTAHGAVASATISTLIELWILLKGWS
jgi:hypothetical protein